MQVSAQLSPREQRQRYDQLKTGLELDRSAFIDLWRQLGDWIYPRRSRFQVTERNQNKDRLSPNIVDGTQTQAATVLQSGMHAGVTSPARPWMRLTTPDPDLAEFGPVKEWLHHATQRMLTVFAQSNLYQALPTMYGDLGVFGTAACAVQDDLPHDLFRAYPFPIGSYSIGLDKRRRANVFLREYERTVAQVIEEFGGDRGQPLERGQPIDRTRFSNTVLAAWDKGEYQTAVKVCWVVTPNLDATPDGLGAQHLPWRSCYFEVGQPLTEPSFLRESGFHEFPILVPRWAVTDEDSYGTNCPGITALADVKSLQIMEKRAGQAIELNLFPPMQGPSALRTQQVSLLPRSMTYVDAREASQRIAPAHVPTLDLSHLDTRIAMKQYAIKEAFYVDLFKMLTSGDPQRGSQPITAEEVRERHEEKLIMLGPVLESINDELLEPLVDRVFAQMQRAGLLPPAPEELHGIDLDVEYTSILAQAQKLVAVSGHERFAQGIAILAPVVPEVLDKFNSDQYVDDLGDMLGVNPELVRSDKDAQAIRQSRQQAQAAQLDAERMAKVGAGVKALGTTPMDGDTALTRAMEGLTQ